MKFPTIFTHINPDLDAVCSVWAAKTYMAGYERAPVRFLPANWDGSDMAELDLALDIEAGGKGLKGPKNGDGTRRSCFAAIIAEHAPELDQRALASLVNYVDIQDAYGSVVNRLMPEANPETRKTLSLTGIGSVLRALQSICRGDDIEVLRRMDEILTGMLRCGRSRIKAEAEVDRPGVVELLADGKVAIVRNAQQYAVNGILFDERGVRVLVYVDGKNIGLIRHNDLALRMDDPAFRTAVEATGETIGTEPGEWFAHDSGFLFCWGARKAPAKTRSKVRPEDLAAVAIQLISQG